MKTIKLMIAVFVICFGFAGVGTGMADGIPPECEDFLTDNGSAGWTITLWGLRALFRLCSSTCSLIPGRAYFFIPGICELRGGRRGTNPLRPNT